MANQRAARGNPKYLRPYDLAKRWGVHWVTLARWRQRGAGPGYLKIGNRILYPLDTVESYEKQSFQVAGSVEAGNAPV